MRTVQEHRADFPSLCGQPLSQIAPNIRVARCTVERMMRVMGLQGVCRGMTVRTTTPDTSAPYPLEHVNRKTREFVELATLQGDWFNHVRLLTPIGRIPPVEAEANYWRQLAASDTSIDVST